MSGINHVAGGVVFTGILGSFWNVNLFERVEYLVVCVVCSLLPDIDHTKSLMGRIFFPISA
jgi:inner membrane protein